LTRIVTSRVMLAIFCLSLVLAVPAAWLRNQIRDTDRYVRTVAPLANDPAIRTALTDRVATLVATQLGEIVVRDGLVDRPFLLAPLVSALDDYVHGTVRTFVMSDGFPLIWEQLNRAAHPAVSALLTGGGTASLRTSDGRVALDLAPLIKQVNKRLGEHGVSIVERIPVDRLDASFVIYQSQALADVQAGVRVLESVAIWLQALAVFSLVASLTLSPDRRQTLLWGGLAVAAAMALFLMLLAFARWWSVDQLPPSVNRDAATAFFETVGRYPRLAFRLFGVLGLLVAAAVIVARPGGRVLKSARRSASERWPKVDRLATSSNEHLLALGIGLGVACCLVVLGVDPLSARMATAVLVILAIGSGVLWLVRASKGEPVVGDGAKQPGSEVPRSRAATDDGRADLVALVAELSADDVRIVRRLAAVLRDSR
jgi:hypothetical protein